MQKNHQEDLLKYRFWPHRQSFELSGSEMGPEELHFPQVPR